MLCVYSHPQKPKTTSPVNAHIYIYISTYLHVGFNEFTCIYGYMPTLWIYIYMHIFSIYAEYIYSYPLLLPVLLVWMDLCAHDVCIDLYMNRVMIYAQSFWVFSQPFGF